MAMSTRLLILMTINLVTGFKDCELDRRTRDQEWQKKLHDDLTANHKWNQPPSKCKPTDVSILFTLRYFELDSENELFTMYTWTNFKWKDERLIWDPKDYGGLTDMFFWTYTFWTPEIELNNKQEDDFGTYYGECKLKYDGNVVCVPRVIDTVQCLTNLRDWPYDRQRCTLEFGISKAQKNVNLKPRYKRAVSMIGSEYGSEWTIVDYEQVENVSAAAQLKITFILERNGESLGSIVLFPSVLLAILTTTTVFLDTDNINRSLMMIFTIFCHFFYMQDLFWEIPRHGKDTPRIVLYFRVSLSFNMFLVVVTIALLKLRKRVTVPPVWVSKVNSIVLESHGKYFVWPRWETKVDSIVSVDKDTESWKDFANIVNSLCLFTTIIVYAIMLSLFIPKQIPF